MRFMMLMIPDVYQNGKSGENFSPTAEAVKKMMKYNEDLAKAGVLISLDGLHPPAAGARISFRGEKPKVTDDPFAGAKNVLGGYWIIQVKSKEEAIEWAKRVPAEPGDMIEIRQLFEISEFPPDVQKAAGISIVQEQVEKLRSSVSG
ncbi:MAG: YciI family protein [Spirochaetota bacterium]